MADDAEQRVMIRQLTDAVKTNSNSVMVLASKVERILPLLERQARASESIDSRLETSIHALRTDVGRVGDETGRVRLLVDRRKEDSGKVGAITKLIDRLDKVSAKTWLAGTGFLLALSITGFVLWMVERGLKAR